LGRQHAPGIKKWSWCWRHDVHVERAGSGSSYFSRRSSDGDEDQIEMQQELIIPELVELRAGESYNIEFPWVEGRILFSSQLGNSKQTVRAPAFTSTYWWWCDLCSIRFFDPFAVFRPCIIHPQKLNFYKMYINPSSHLKQPGGK
jgi:hypothetical protein